METDLVSIVIPAYNHENYIDGCIDSMIAQTYQNIELIVVNDGSPDNTAKRIETRIEECEKRFSNFIFIDKENEGVVKTFNRGARLAKGRFIAICASDDAFTPDAIETMYTFLASNPEYVVAVGDNFIIDDDGRSCFWDANRENVYDKSSASYETFGQYLKSLRASIDFSSPDFGSYESLLLGNYIPNGYLINREIFVDEIGAYHEQAPLEDLYLHLQMSKYGKYKYFETPLFYYRWHAANTVKQLNRMAELEAKTFDQEKQFAEKAGLIDTYNRVRDKQGSRDRELIPFILKIKEHGSAEKYIFQLKLLGLNIFEVKRKGTKKTTKLFYIPVLQQSH